MSLDLSPDDLGTPDGYECSVYAGWASAAAIADNPQMTSPLEQDVNGIRLPSAFELAIGKKGAGLIAFLQFTGFEGGELEVRLTSALTRADLDLDEVLDEIRALRPVSWWKRKAVWSLIQTRLVRDRLGVSLELPDANDFELIRRMLGVKAARTRLLVNDELYEKVAKVYLDALAAASENPTVAVQRALGKSYPTAARYVAEARKRGLLEIDSSAAADLGMIGQLVRKIMNDEPLSPEDEAHVAAVQAVFAERGARSKM